VWSTGLCVCVCVCVCVYVCVCVCVCLCVSVCLERDSPSHWDVIIFSSLCLWRASECFHQTHFHDVSEEVCSHLTHITDHESHQSNACELASDFPVE